MRVDGVRHKLNHLLFANDTVLKSDSEDKLQMFVSICDLVCKNKKIKVNVKIKVM